MRQSGYDACMTPAPKIACILSALSPDERSRRQHLAHDLRGMVTGLRELDDGFAFALRPSDDAWMAAAEFVSLERRCCPFLEFALLAPSGDSGSTLRLTGRPGVKDFLRDELGL